MVIIFTLDGSSFSVVLKPGGGGCWKGQVNHRNPGPEGHGNPSLDRPGLVPSKTRLGSNASCIRSGRQNFLRGFVNTVRGRIGGFWTTRVIRVTPTVGLLFT